MAAIDDYATTAPDRREAPPRRFLQTPTLSNTVDLPHVTRAIRFAAAGDVALVSAEDDTGTITGILAGETLVGQFKRIKVTGTTIAASAMTIFW